MSAPEIDPFATSLPFEPETFAEPAAAAQPTSTGFEDLRPGADAPSWQQETFESIANDQTLTSDEKRIILEQKPHSWGKVKQWRSAARAIGKFADEQVPLDEFFDILEQRSRNRVTDLEVASIERLAKDPVKIQAFAERNPRLYAEFLESLVTEHEEFVSSALAKKGYQLTRGTPKGAADILAKFKDDEYYQSLIEGTDFEESLIAELSKLQTNDPAPAATEDSRPTAQLDEQIARTQETLSHVMTNVWSKDVADGLKAAGIRPATEQEKAANPAAAYLKNIVFTIAQYGLPGVVDDWDSQIDKFASGQPGYQETLVELETLLKDGKFDRFKDNARSLSPTYYTFGQRRANIPLIQTLYKFVDGMLGQASGQAVQQGDARRVPESVPQGGPAPGAKSGFVSDRIFLDKLRSN